MIRQFTTPTLNITLKHKDGIVADDLVFDYLIFSLRNACYRIDRTIQFENVVEGVFQVEFTQEETSRMKLNDVVEMEINFFKNDKRFATNIKQMIVDRNLLNEVIQNE